MITVKQFYLNELRECCYILSDESKECVIVDPGISSRSEQERVVKYIAEEKLTPVKLLCTHGHFDHVMGNSFITKTYNIPTYIHPKDRRLLTMARNTCALFGIDIENPPMDNMVDINDSDTVTFGNSTLKVISTPGHTWGSVLFYNPEEKICLSGDTVFAGNCGRTDLPEGSNQAMMTSLTQTVASLPEDTQIFPGHGPSSTIREELAVNPYLRKETWLRFDI